jgi:ABC-type multidrug transport system ATPase subunit
VIDRIAFAADVLELGRKYRSVSLGFDLENGRRSLNPAQLQALVFLRRLKLVDIRACLLMRNNFARVEVGSISSGQQQTMCTSFGLMAKLRDNSLVLVDDPEIGLHPRMQQEFCGHLASALAPFKGCHVVIATHSALLVQRASEMKYGVISLNKPRGRVTETGAVTVPLYVDESRSVESVLFDNFDTPILNSNLIPNELFRIAVELDYAGVTERALLIERLAEIEAAYVDRKDAIRERRLIELAKDIIRQDDDRRSSTEHHG